MSAPTPFKIDISDAFLAATKAKLEAARFPGEIELQSGAKWTYGTPLATVKDLATYWRDSFDWRKVEAELNEMPQFMSRVEAPGREPIDLHFVHQKSTRSDAIPLLFLHGWPGNFTEVKKILPLLTEPEDGSQAYHVIAPSLPGFVFSSSPKRPGFDLLAMAATVNQLMVDLGYDHYVAQGGDWGSFLCRALALHHTDRCLAIHLNMFVTPPPSSYNPFEILKYLGGGYSKREIEYLKQTEHFMKEETGYQGIQSTKPQTLNYGLTDSPVAMLAWIREKLESWTDDYAWRAEEIITWVMLYYATGKPATHIYKEAKANRAALVASRISIPVGVSLFPKELYKVPRSWAEKVAHIVTWKVHERGGHFAATEVPEVLVADFREFIEKLKTSPAWTQKAKF